MTLQPFLLRKVFWSGYQIQPIADQREAHQCCHPEFSNHRFALLPSALFVELSPRCQLGVLDWKRVLPSRSRTECLFPETLFLARAAVTRTRRFPLQSLSSSSFFLILSCIVVSQWFVHLTRHPQPMK